MKMTLATLVLVLFVFTAPVSAQVTVITGIGSSLNLGESLGAVFGLRAEAKDGILTLESTTYFDSSQKKDGGWKGGETALVRVGGDLGIFGGMDFRYRDGGPWVKKTVWVVGGLSYRKANNETRIFYRHHVYESHDNFIKALQAEVRLQGEGSRLGLTWAPGILFLQDTHDAPQRYGFFQTLALTVQLGKKPGT